MKRIVLLLLSCLLLSMTTGCGAYKATVDERSVKEIASDEWITGQITAEFLQDDIVKVLDIGANSYLGNVYLYGEYDNEPQKNRAISIAKSIDGVRSVTPYLLPKKENDLCGTSDNLTIRGKLDKDLITDERIWSTNVDIAVVQCHIILMGIVGSTTEKSLAEQYAKSIREARNVRSYLRVKK